MATCEKALVPTKGLKRHCSTPEKVVVRELCTHVVIKEVVAEEQDVVDITVIICILNYSTYYVIIST